MRVVYSNDILWAVPWLFSILLSIILLALRRRSLAKFARENGCQQPTCAYPQYLFLFGLDYVLVNGINILKHRFAEGVQRFFHRFGSTWTASVFGKQCFHTNDPENLRAVMTTHFEDYTIIPAREKLVQTLFGGGVFATNGNEWTHSRNLIRQALSRMTLDESTYEKHASGLIQDILVAGRDGTNFYDLAYRYTSDLTSDLYFAESTRDSDANGSERSAILQRSFASVGKIARSMTLFGSRIPYVAPLLYRESRPTKLSVYSIIESYIHDTQERLKSSEEKAGADRARTTLTEAFIQTTDDARRARIEIMNLMMAGNETVAIGLSELIWNLARHPRVWTKLRSEVEKVFQGRTPSLNELKKLDYLRCVVNESLRLRPTLSVHGRLSLRDTVLPRGGGPEGKDPIVVPRSSYVIYSNYALNRNPQVFGPDIEVFRPERWSGMKEPRDDDAGVEGTEPLKHDRFEFLSFLAGPRACPGENLGTSMVSYAVVRLAQEFEEVEARDDRPWEEATAFSFYNRHGVHVSFMAEQSAET